MTMLCGLYKPLSIWQSHENLCYGHMRTQARRWFWIHRYSVFSGTYSTSIKEIYWFVCAYSKTFLAIIGKQCGFLKSIITQIYYFCIESICQSPWFTGISICYLRISICYTP
jgi:hypothetical protein